eukprot:CAMPEP_0197022860 /NCGR_PEP_ID=MMETSP1384-20130603/3661_1 /TAXON_ID=29189 /ORGANISM="Ammonia sp." /LENGTH=893 /DNA_ID=CAMNT_0042450971 /DNA_START=21 /DNA_END=2702 /DNA_ORIENTATION=+
MISAFLKKTFDNKQINLVRPLQVYVRDAYGKDKEKEKMGAIQEIQQYRDSCNVDESSVSPVAAIAKMETYLAYVCILQKRFSFGKSGRGVFSKASKVEVSFKWVDSYRHTKIEQSMDIGLEKCAIMFNLGALMSLHAVKLSEQDEEGLKAACKLFRESAGVFEYMAQNSSNDTIQFVQNMDIQKDSCKLLANLMLAQAQACFAEMAIRKKMKAKLISTLAIGTSELFQQCVGSIDMTAALKSWIEKGEYNFRAHCLHQQEYYTAIAHYYESQRVATLAEEGVYGKEIAWLKSANSILSSLVASSSKAKLIPTLQQHTKSLIRKLSPRLKEAVKDNNDIYHDPIPNVAAMKKIAGRQNVAIIEYKPKLDCVQDPFKNMVPKETQKKADQLKAQFQGEIQAISARCNEQNDSARAILASLGLPAAVDCAQSQTGLPDAVWDRITECKKIGGLKELNTVYSRIESINGESWKILQEEIVKVLDVEQSIDTQIRTKLGSQWQRTDSMQLQREYRQQISTIESHLTTAATTNSKIEKSMQDNETQFVEFDKSREELAEQLPNVDEVKNNEEAEQLKAFLDELSQLIAKRDELRNEYETEVNNLDLSQLFMQNPSATVDTIKNLAKQSLTELTKQIDDGVIQQAEVLEKISTQNELFVASKQSDPKQTQREQIIHVLNETCVKFKDCERHLKEGLKFYSDLMADYILPLKEEIDNYCAARESERDLLLADLGQNVAKLAIDLSASSPPSIQSQPQPQPQPAAVQPQAQQPAEQKQQAPPLQAQPQAQHPPASGYNPYYSQQPPPQAQSPQYQQQPPPQGYYQQQPPPQGYYQQPPPQGAPYYYQQPPPQGAYAQQPPPQGYYPPQPYYQQQPPPQQGGYNPAYQPPANNNNTQPSAPPQ